MRQRFQIELDVDANIAWAAISQRFGDTAHWTSLLEQSHLEGELGCGGRRVCCNRISVYVEEISAFDEAGMSLEYELTEGKPVIIERAINTWSIESSEQGNCILTMQPDIRLYWWSRPLAPFVRLGLRVQLRKVLEEFKHWIETGRVHPRKAAQNLKLAKA